MLRSLLCTALFALALAAQAAPRIERVEPLHWWVGMQDPSLQLMVHGPGVAELTPRIERAGVTLAGTQRSDNPNYLWLDLVIAPDAAPGSVRIEFLRGNRRVAVHDYRLEARAPGSAQRKGFGPEDVIYLVTPDRYANGDPANDTVKGMADGLDRRSPLGRHGGDLAGLIAAVPYVAGMGYTQVWLNPVLENDQPSVSYHGYSTTDFYRVDPRYGSNELYRRYAQELGQRGIGLIKDVVLNHIGSGHWWMRDLPAKDWINNGGQFTPTNHGRETILDPYYAEADRKAFTDGWFVPTMPDLNQRNPLLARYLVQNAIWWVEYAGLSGIRVDTWAYSDKAFLSEWTRRLTQEYPRLNIVGEEWTSNTAITSWWQRGNRNTGDYVSSLPTLFDFSLQEALAQGLVEKDGWAEGLPRIYRSIANDFQFPDPSVLVTFPDNHDMSRIWTRLGERLDLWKMALGVVLTTRGIPNLYYGTEILMGNPGTEDHGIIRSDFPGGWTGDAVNAFTGAGLTAQQREAQDWLRKLQNWRKGADAIHRGKLTHFRPEGGSYVYFRHSDRQKVMVVVHRSAEARTLDTARFAEVIGGDTAAVDVMTGQRHALETGLKLAPNSVAILELGPPGADAQGTLRHYPQVASKHVMARDVWVWTPPGYGRDPARRYPVVYMHDGQNVFDASGTRSIAGVNWGVDTTLARLQREGRIRPAIVVGIASTERRGLEYAPRKPVGERGLDFGVPGLPAIKAADLQSDAYLRFLVEELKPFVDATYATLPDRANTFIMGSSMGGLISAYALAEYPQVFGGAGCVSTHWPAGDGIMIDWLARQLPQPGQHRWWFDFGTRTLDALYEPYQQRMDERLRAAGYAEGRDWVTRKYVDAEHSERAWRQRVDEPLLFLLGRP